LYEHIKQSIYGGRSVVSRTHFKSKDVKSIEENCIVLSNGSKIKIGEKGKTDMTIDQYEAIGDYVADMDVVSLYPAVMLEEYPVGQPFFTDNYCPTRLDARRMGLNGI